MSSTTSSRRPTLTDDANLHVESETWLNDRLVEISVATAALPHPAKVRVLLPNGYGQPIGLVYPTLWLLHGGLGGFRDWTDQGQIEALTKDLDVICVMPSGGKGGWYRNWNNFGKGGVPQWETFHMGQLLPWLEATLATSGQRGIAGVSMGGYGALSYAARHPGLFASAVSFSGAVNTRFPIVQSLICVSSMAHHRLPFAINKLPIIGRSDWHDHNPWDLAESLRSMHLALYTGDGRPTRFGRDERPKDLQEHQVHLMNVSLHDRLDKLGISHTWRDYGPATHTWDNWSRGMSEELPTIMTHLAEP